MHLLGAMWIIGKVYRVYTTKKGKKKMVHLPFALDLPFWQLMLLVFVRSSRFRFNVEVWWKR